MCGNSTQAVFVLQEQKEISRAYPKARAGAAWTLSLSQVGWARPPQATCGAFHPGLTDWKHYSCCDWHHVAQAHTVLTPHFLLSPAVSNTELAGKQTHRAAPLATRLQAVPMCSLMAIPWHEPNLISLATALDTWPQETIYFLALGSIDRTDRPVSYQEIYSVKRCFWQISINSFCPPRSKLLSKLSVLSRYFKYFTVL